ncbi:putative transporter C3B8.04c, partial [Tetrabaena socialis]
YAHLKKYIYALAKKEADLRAGGLPLDEEGGVLAPLLAGPTEEGFQLELDSQLTSTLQFLAVKEAELLARVSELEVDLQSLEKIPSRVEASSLSSRLGGSLMPASPSTLDLAKMVASTPPEDHRKIRIRFWENPPRHVFSVNLNTRRIKLQGRFQAVPLFVTSMALPLLVVTSGVLVDRSVKDAPQRLTPQQAAPAIFHAMFSQTIMLLLGGFAIAAALSKHAIAKQESADLDLEPRNVLLAAMFTATFASMWISNVAAPVLCFGLIQPILRTLDPGHPFAKALVMGIALASNVGGMTSPISSPQNIFAIERMSMDGHPPSWLMWFAVALPVSIATNFICWLVLLLVYQPGRAIAEVRPIKPNTDPINGTQVYIVLVSLLTVAAWCANTFLQRYMGEMGIIAIVPLVAFFGFDVLNKDDFNSMLWNVVMLAMGGLSLGEAVKSSGLLAALALDISNLVQGLDLWQVAAVFCGLVLVATTFISHTVGAMVILPIVQSVGEAMAGTPHPKLLVMASALMCSGAMGLPVSGFPNMNAVSLEDSTGSAIVSTRDFLMVGLPSSVFAYGIIISLGYALMLLIGL